MKRPDSISWIWRPSRNNFAQVPPKLREILSQLKRDVWIRSFAKSADSCHDNLLTLECSSRPCICHHSTIETSRWDWHQQGESLHQSAATDITGYQIPTESLMWLRAKSASVQVKEKMLLHVKYQTTVSHFSLTTLSQKEENTYYQDLSSYQVKKTPLNLS